MTEYTTLPTVCWRGYNLPEHNFLIVIPARGGSKGFLGKNIAVTLARPLLEWTLDDAKDADLPGIKTIVVSTDDDNIAAVAQANSVEVITRPKELSGDRAPSEWALRHVMDSVGFRPDYVIMLQATSPIRTPRDIENAVYQIIEEGTDSLLSVVPSHKFIWRGVSGNCYPLNYDKDARPMRQFRPNEYFENGSIYIFKPWVLDELANRLGGQISLYRMGFWSQFEIDSLEDLRICEYIMKQGWGGYFHEIQPT